MFKNHTATLDDVLLVGPDKPVGYKLLRDLALLSKTDPAQLQQRLEAKGLKTLILTGADCAMDGGALYAWDEDALAAFLDKNAGTLAQCGWPATPEAFIRQLAIDWAPPKTKLYDLIADAFGDKDNSGRSNAPANNNAPGPRRP